MIQLKRFYDKPSNRDGLWILFELLWIRGMAVGANAFGGGPN